MLYTVVIISVSHHLHTLARMIIITRESVVLEDDLVNDTAAGFPEADAVFGSGRGQEVVHLLVDVLGPGQVLVALNLGLDQVVAVDGGWHRHLNMLINVNKLRGM